MTRHLPLCFLCLRSGKLIALCLLVLVSALVLNNTPKGVRAQGTTVPQTTFTVTTLNDSGTGSLRQAVMDANNNPGHDTINFSVTGTIDLAGALPDLSDDVSIVGPGANGLTVRRDAGGNYRIFTITATGTVSVSGLTISNGFVNGDFPDNQGGGMSNSGTGTVNLENSVVSGNSSVVYGGGIMNYSSGTVNITNSTVAGNSSILFGGGGILNRIDGTVNIVNSTVVGNHAASFGGGAINSGRGTLNVINSTVSGNDAIWGGGIAGFAGIATSIINVTNSTLSGNSAGLDGGGIWLSPNSTLNLWNSTITGNSAHANGGGVLINGGEVHGTTRSSIIALNRNSLSPDLLGQFASGGSNFIGAIGGGTGFVDGANNDQVGTIASPKDPRLEMDPTDPTRPLLKHNGGTTQTIALQSGSPAIDRGKNTASLTTDQRGHAFVRTYDDPLVSNGLGDGTDIGAFEVQRSFDVCIQAYSGGNLLQVNTATGEYQFTNCGGLSIGGTGTILRKGGLVTLQHMGGGRRVLAKIDSAAHKATASIQLLSQGMAFTVIDRNTADNTCSCN